MTKRNGLVDILRLLFAGIIAMFHFYSRGAKHFHGGRYGVEFFMILAGFLFFAAWEKRGAGLDREGQIAWWKSYTIKRYVRFFWYSLVAFALAFAVVRIWHDGLRSPGHLADKLSGDVWEILMLKFVNGLFRGNGVLNGPSWTLGCMLFAEWLLTGLTIYFKKPFLTIVMPCTVLFGFGWWMNAPALSNELSLGWITFGMLRVYLLTCMGIFSYQLCRWLKKQFPAERLTRAGALIFTLAEFLCYAFCLWVTCFRSSRNYQFCVIVVFTAAFAISFSGLSWSGKLFPSNRFTNFCAEYSLAIYLIHRSVQRYYEYTYPDLNDMYRQKFSFLAVTLAVSLAYLFVMRGLFKLLPIAKKKLKSMMVKES